MGYWDVHELRCINGPDVANSVMCRIVNGGPCVEVPDSSFGRLCERRCAHTLFRLSAVTDASSQVGETRRASTLALARLLPHLSRHASQASVHLVATLQIPSLPTMAPACTRQCSAQIADRVGLEGLGMLVDVLQGPCVGIVAVVVECL